MEIVAELLIGIAGEAQCCPGRDVASSRPTRTLPPIAAACAAIPLACRMWPVSAEQAAQGVTSHQPCPGTPAD